MSKIKVTVLCTKPMRAYVIIACAVLSLVGCGKEDPVSVRDFPIYGTLPVSEQYRLPFAPLNADHCIYVSGDKIMVEEWNADYKWCVYSLADPVNGFTAGRVGRGPDEFVSDPYIFIPTPGDGSFVAYDSDADNFKRFSFETDRLIISDNIENKMQQRVPATLLAKIDDNAYLCRNDSGNTEFILLDPHTGNYREFADYPRFISRQAEMSDRPSFWVGITYRPVAKPDGTRFATFYFHYKYFRIFDKTGKILKEVSVNIEPYTDYKPTTDPDPFTFAYDSTFASDDYIYAICRNDDHSDPNPQSELQVWSWDGEPVASYRLDKKAVFGYITLHDMKLYSFAYLDKDQNEACINIWDLSLIPH